MVPVLNRRLDQVWCGKHPHLRRNGPHVDRVVGYLLVVLLAPRLLLLLRVGRRYMLRPVGRPLPELLLQYRQHGYPCPWVHPGPRSVCLALMVVRPDSLQEILCGVLSMAAKVVADYIILRLHLGPIGFLRQR